MIEFDTDYYLNKVLIDHEKDWIDANEGVSSTDNNRKCGAKVKKYLKVFLSILILSGVIVINIFDKSKNNREAEESKELEIKAIMVGNMFATYENIDRELDMDYFYNLNCGTTYSKIEDEIGEPNGGVGSGVVRPYYQVGDQYVVMCFSLNEEGEYDKLSEMSLYTKEKYIDEIPLK